MITDRDALRAEIINTPETADFMAAVPIEAAHQRERWRAAHDAGKTAFDWFWLIGYLAQKAASAAVLGDVRKAKHHTISTAAALANWHAALEGADSTMRPGLSKEIQDAADGVMRIKVEEADRSDWPQKSPEEISDIIRNAYLAGAMAVHTHWLDNPGEAPRGDPEFGEAAYDYMMSVGPMVLAEAEGR